MKETTARLENSQVTIGLDLGDRKHSYCVVNDKGETIKEGSVINARERLSVWANGYGGR